MRVTETLMAPGAWSLKLREQAGLRHAAELRTALAAYDATTDSWVPKLDGYIAVFDTPTTSPTLAAARYVGVLTGRNGRNGYSGEGLAALLNRNNGDGVVATGTTAYSSRSLDAWLDVILPVNGLTKGTVSVSGLSNVAGSWTLGQGARELLEQVCRGVGGAEWRIGSDGTVDAGPVGSLFRSGEVMIAPDMTPGVGAIRGVSGSVTSLTVDASLVVSDVVVAGQGEGGAMITGTASAGSTRVYGLDGFAAEVTAVVNAPDADVSAASALASATLALRAGPRDSFRVAVDDPYVMWYVDAGDTVYVWDQLAGIEGGDPVPWAGSTAYPQVKRVHTMSMPVPPNATVMLWRSSVNEWTDLTSAVEFDGGASFLTVGTGRGPVDWAGSQGPAWLGEASQVVQ